MAAPRPIGFGLTSKAHCWLSDFSSLTLFSNGTSDSRPKTCNPPKPPPLCISHPVGIILDSVLSLTAYVWAARTFQPVQPSEPLTLHLKDFSFSPSSLIQAPLLSGLLFTDSFLNTSPVSNPIPLKSILLRLARETVLTWKLPYVTLMFICFNDFPLDWEQNKNILPKPCTIWLPLHLRWLFWLFRHLKHTTFFCLKVFTYPVPMPANPLGGFYGWFLPRSWLKCYFSMQSPLATLST